MENKVLKTIRIVSQFSENGKVYIWRMRDDEIADFIDNDEHYLDTFTGKSAAYTYLRDEIGLCREDRIKILDDYVTLDITSLV